MQAFHQWQKGNPVYQEEIAFRAKWPLRILGKAFPYYSTIDKERS